MHVRIQSTLSKFQFILRSLPGVLPGVSLIDITNDRSSASTVILMLEDMFSSEITSLNSEEFQIQVIISGARTACKN